jgi:N utilization substance protein A
LELGCGTGRVALAMAVEGFCVTGVDLSQQMLDVFRDIAEEEIEDIYLDEFNDEIEQWVIDALKSIGCDTAKAVLAIPKEELISRADLEEETVVEILNILRAEFEGND